MKVIEAEHMGFCMGVRKAMQIVNSIIENEKNCKIYTFGPLIHNRLVLEELSHKGVMSIDDPDDASGGIAIIRAHGVHPEVRKKLEEKTARVVDATCPRVLESQKKAGNASAKGYTVVIAGDKNHGEVQGIAGHAQRSAIISSTEEASALEVQMPALLLSQTTFSREEYGSICSILKKRYPEIEILKSICPATEKRQKALENLAGRVEAVVVVGGKNSANTVGLYKTALMLVKNAWHIENSDEIPDEIRKFSVVGITAGASTPDWIIKEVADKLKSY